MADYDNMTIIMERRDQLISTSAPSYNKAPSDGTTLITPKARGVPKKSRLGLVPTIILVLGACIPAVVQYFTLALTKSSLLTLIVMSALYSLLVFVHSYLVDKHAWMALGEQDIRPSFLLGKYNQDLVLSATMAAISFSLVTCLYSAYIPFGPSEVDIFMSSGNGFVRFFLWFFYFVLQAVVLPLFESFFFFFVLLSYLYTSLQLNGILAVIYGLTQFSWIVQSVGGIGWIIFLTLMATILGWLFSVAARRESFLKGFGMRFGVAIGLCIYIQFLNIGVAKGWTKSPTNYYTNWN